MARGKRYDGESKLNLKKLIAVLIFILVVVMFVIGINFLLTSNSKNTSGKIETITYYTIYDNAKWGVINSNGETVIEPKYDEMILVPDSTKSVFICTYDVNYTDGTYKTKVIDTKEKEIITGYEKIEAIANYDENQNIWYESNVLRVQKDGKYGLVNFIGNELLECTYDTIEPIQGIGKSLIIKKEDDIGLCDDLGNIIIEPNYKKIEKIEDSYKNGYIVVDANNKYGIIGTDKTIVLECKYEEIKGIYSNNLFVIKQDKKWQVINKEGEVLLQNQFDEVEDINGEYITAKKNGKLGVLDTTGNIKIKFEYDELKNAGNNAYIAKKGDKYGVIDIEENEKLPYEFNNITYITTGDFLIADYIENEVKVSNIIDSNYETKITGTLFEINEQKGYIRMYLDDNYKYYNFKFEEKPLSSFSSSNTLFLTKKDGKYGFINKEGKTVVDYIYDDATEQNSSGYAAIKKEGKWGSIDIKGKIVIEPEYNLDGNEIIDFIGAWHICEDKNANYYLDV